MLPNFEMQCCDFLATKRLLSPLGRAAIQRAGIKTEPDTIHLLKM
jgi:hypothetical protein